jgi:hypothetical protein
MAKYCFVKKGKKNKKGKKGKKGGGGGGGAKAAVDDGKRMYKNTNECTHWCCVEWTHWCCWH